MKDEYTTNSHYLTYKFLPRKDGRMYFLKLGVKGLNYCTLESSTDLVLCSRTTPVWAPRSCTTSWGELWQNELWWQERFCGQRRWTCHSSRGIPEKRWNTSRTGQDVDYLFFTATCEPGRRKHKHKHTRAFLFLALVLASSRFHTWLMPALVLIYNVMFNYPHLRK